MEWAPYALDVLRVVIWPAVVVSLALWLGRDELRSFMRRLRKGSAFGTSWELESQTAAASAGAQAALQAENLEAAKKARERAASYSVRANEEPVAVILDWRDELEEELETFAGKGSFSSNVRALKEAPQGSGIDERGRWTDLLQNLYEVRNMVARGQTPVSRKIALEFARGSASVQGYLSGLIRVRSIREVGDSLK